jgi:hypothetical protein
MGSERLEVRKNQKPALLDNKQDRREVTGVFLDFPTSHLTPHTSHISIGA